MVAIVDYGVGNLFSLECSLNAIGAEVTVTADPAVLRSADQVLLPGVGAFGDAAEKLHATGLDAVLKELSAEGKPLLGICLGMQLLFEKGYEYGEHEGLGLISGEVISMENTIPSGLKIPHMGWNQIEQLKSPLFATCQENDYVYFVLSYYVPVCAHTIATTQYAGAFSAALNKNNFYATQFHPEKSGDVGSLILEQFIKL